MLQFCVDESKICLDQYFRTTPLSISNTSLLFQLEQEIAEPPMRDVSSVEAGRDSTKELSAQLVRLHFLCLGGVLISPS